MSITAFSFGEWLPDLPDLGNPGITEARNLISFSGGYTPYLPAVVLGNAISQRVIRARRTTGAGAIGLAGVVYAAAASGTALSFYSSDVLDTGVWTNITPAVLTASSGPVEFLQYNNYVIAIDHNNTPIYNTFGSATTFAPLSSSSGTAPSAACGAVINQFVVLGNLYGVTGQAYTVQWSGIDAPLSWPTPSSATAIAQQSGRQYLEPSMEAVLGISSGDQFGLILQRGGIVRMTYVGPPAVFGFEVIYRGGGPLSQGAWIQVNGLVYFISAAGFFVSDGVQVIPIGDGKVDRYFANNVDSNNLNYVNAGVDYARELIYWTLPKTTDATAGNPEEMLVYSYRDKRWTHVFDSVRVFVSASEFVAQFLPIEVIHHTNKLAHLSGSAGTAIVATGEVEPQPGGCALINGIKPVIASSGTAPTLGVQVGSRDDQATSVSYSSTATPTSRTGFADLRSDARYHRARVYIAGNFDKAMGLEIDATPTGGL